MAIQAELCNSYLNNRQACARPDWEAQTLYTASFNTKSVPADQPMLLPLTSAVYVTGKLASNDSILLDIGTGYYAEVM